MEGKKKFEKPELQVVEMKLAVLGPGSCFNIICDGCHENEHD